MKPFFNAFLLLGVAVFALIGSGYALGVGCSQVNYCISASQWGFVSGTGQWGYYGYAVAGSNVSWANQAVVGPSCPSDSLIYSTTSGTEAGCLNTDVTTHYDVYSFINGAKLDCTITPPSDGKQVTANSGLTRNNSGQAPISVCQAGG